jgi:hypothetical protein
MIPSMTPSDRPSRPDAVPVSDPSASRAQPVLPDRISTENAAFLRTALDRQPAVRPEVVERARALAADPTYPSVAIMKQVASMILASPDLSESAS